MEKTIRQQGAKMQTKTKDIKANYNIEKYLVLNKYLLSLFGVREFRELQNKLRDARVGYDSDGKSYFVNILRSSFDLKIKEDKLLEYDENIRSYAKEISSKREPVNLKYFQYLAVLFTEIVLDNLKNRRYDFLRELNEFLEEYKREQNINIISSFPENDFKKLAFWMATGSGKTLVMHINYHQFFKYEPFTPNNILLITPNESLSKQHYEELNKSGIPCELYPKDINIMSKGLFKSIRIIEITKLVEEKKGSGTTLPVEVFEGENLVFVDEGHKGQAGNDKEEMKWRKIRNSLVKNGGLVFEYSATFGQILSPPSLNSKKEKASDKIDKIFEEYAKSIIFDYSYKYFYLDGYGKDFSVLNIKNPDNSEKFQETMFIANLLSFYEQLLIYKENKEKVKQYNIEKPLWIFVGATVAKENKDDDATISDVVQIIKFMKKALEDKEWLKGRINEILDCGTDPKNEKDNDVFLDRFHYIREKRKEGKGLISELYKYVFGGEGKLILYEIKNAQGEIGLKAGESPYFGVVNIGNVSGLKKQLEKQDIEVKQDAISSSLFDKIKSENSEINILIGSRKFIEGWDTWRVSCMGLLNIGRGQGPQIIQLFGRGVRLKGEKMSLKRSGENSEISYLETLYIYGIKADYLNKFLEAIKKEEVYYETITIPIKYQHEDKWKDLYILAKPERKFEKEKILKLSIDDKIVYTVDLLPKVQLITSENEREKGIKKIETKPKEYEVRRDKFEDIIDLLDWQKIYQEVCYFKTQRGYWNLIFDIETLKEVLQSSEYKLLCSPEIFEPKSISDIKKLEDIAVLVIEKYLDLFYKKEWRKFETEELQYCKLSQSPPSSFFKDKQGYVVQIEKKNENLIENIKKLAQDLNKILDEENGLLPRIYFDRSLYVPILLESEKVDKISPPGLVKSEEKFIKDLKEYLENNSSKFSNVEIYLLRNLPKVGVGFQLEWSGFYPDFIMWLKRGEKQVIVFIDPHGLEHVKSLNNEKIAFAEFIKDIERKLNNKNISLESFILSPTEYNKLIKGETKFPSKEDFKKHHVLFSEDSDWPEVLFNTDLIKEILNSKSSS